MHNFARDFDNEELQIAAMIHPKFKTSWIPENERARKIQILQKVFDGFKFAAGDSR